MTFSVIVPTYRRPRDLRRCLQAILAGTRRPDELIVVVRDTDHESQCVLDECRNTEGGAIIRSAVVSTPGQIAAINAGLAIAKGDVVVFTDDDTRPAMDWLERLARGYEDPSVVGVGGRDRIDGLPDEGPAERVGVITWYGAIIGNHHRGCKSIQRVQHLKGVNMSFRREVLPPFDHRLFRAASMLNDTDASLNAGKHGVLLYDPEAIVDHYASERGAGITRDVNDPATVRADSHNWVYCMLKHLPWRAKLVFLVYAFVVGQGARIGLLLWVWRAVKGQPRSLRQLGASTLGKLEGLCTYFNARVSCLVPRQPEAVHVP